MPQTSLRGAMRYVVAVLVMIRLPVLVVLERDCYIVLPLDSTTIVAVISPQVLQFTIPNGSVYAPGIKKNTPGLNDFPLYI